MKNNSFAVDFFCFLFLGEHFETTFKLSSFYTDNFRK